MSDTAVITPAADPATFTYVAPDRPDRWGADLTSGQRARTFKLLRQLAAANALVANAPAALGKPPFTPRSLLSSNVWALDPSMVDYYIWYTRRCVVMLHEWRGHTASLPADRR